MWQENINKISRLTSCHAIRHKTVAFVRRFAIITLLATGCTRPASISEDAMPDVHRIKVKLGDAEFEAEGSQEAVQAQYDRFLEAVALIGAKPAKTPPNSLREKHVFTPDAEFDDALMSRVFELRDDGLVVLRVQPTTDERDADALVMLLFGYRRLKNEQQVLATQLLKAARQSGLGIERVDRAIATYMPRFILRGGQRKGTTYTLTTQGAVRAEEVIEQMF
jgi:hypothetical protein